ncbi:olfactory receptor 52D1-like [Megalops cyprinoides]|uniref:olfactory receptor 52D1-like n=1 Tax=Megalops cyprinoides TaxID=118141 RepID=UPI001863EF6F|nr:olfactory receptor 52D1-like [Megalops cyprinoides]
MENATTVTSFILTAYSEMDNLKYLHFFVFLVLYILIIIVSSILTVVTYIERALHEPMYLLVCNLAVNGVYGSTGLLPALLGHLVSETHEVSLGCCLAQVFCLHTYATVEFTILAVMGYDRYIAVCYPLHYHSIMSISRTWKLIAFSWIYPCSIFIMYFSLTLRLTFCGRFIEKVYCVNFELVKLACAGASLINIVGLVSIIFFILPQLFMILFSYAQILRVCLRSSKESQIKALQTCTPHLLSVINYSVGSFFEIIQSRLNMSHVPPETRIFMSLYFILFPPMLNPVIYGMTIHAIRVRIFSMFRVRKW